MAVQLPIDNLENLWPNSLKGLRVGALLHPASVACDLEHTLTRLQSAEKKGLFKLTTLFGPQHGIHGHTQDNMIEWEGGRDEQTGLPVYSLYGELRKPSAAMLENLDVLFVDLQDVGARYYTFIWTLFLCMEAALEQGKTVVVADRPNPIGNAVEGPILELDHSSFVGLWKIPVRHGRTIGELAEQFRDEAFPGLSVHVLPMNGYKPEMWWEDTGLPWVLPSPNMPTVDTAAVYPGMCLLEATNVSEGRGTTRPFEIFGAPFIDAAKLCAHMNALDLGGVHFRACHFQPTFHKWAGEFCNGAQIHVTDRAKLQPFRMTVEILRYLFKNHPEFAWRTDPYEYEYKKLAIDILLGSGSFRKNYIEQDQPLPVKWPEGES